jgi:hypothetical protein
MRRVSCYLWHRSVSYSWTILYSYLGCLWLQRSRKWWWCHWNIVTRDTNTKSVAKGEKNSYSLLIYDTYAYLYILYPLCVNICMCVYRMHPLLVLDGLMVPYFACLVIFIAAALWSSTASVRVPYSPFMSFMRKLTVTVSSIHQINIIGFFFKILLCICYCLLWYIIVFLFFIFCLSGVLYWNDFASCDAAVRTTACSLSRFVSSTLCNLLMFAFHLCMDLWRLVGVVHRMIKGPPPLPLYICSVKISFSLSGVLTFLAHIALRLSLLGCYILLYIYSFHTISI